MRLTEDRDIPASRNRRRELLKRGWKWALGMTAAMLVQPLVSFVNFTIPRKPRYVQVRKKLLPGNFAVERNFILFVDEKGAWAVSRKCTHLGCRVHYLEERQIIECPCHQSRFSPKGIRLSGPAKKNLPTFPVETLSNDDGDASSQGYIVTL